MSYDQPVALSASGSKAFASSNLADDARTLTERHALHSTVTSTDGEEAREPTSAEGEPIGSVRYTAADFRRELERVRRCRRRNIALAIIGAILIGAIVSVAFVSGAAARSVVGAGMEPVLSQGQAVVTAHVGSVGSGTIVAYDRDDGQMSFGRVVAEPGEWVSVGLSGKVAVSGSALGENAAKSVFGADAESIVSREVPAGAYYVLGDAESATVAGIEDETDFVDGGRIVGTAIFRVWPIIQMGPIA